MILFMLLIHGYFFLIQLFKYDCLLFKKSIHINNCDRKFLKAFEFLQFILYSMASIFIDIKAFDEDTRHLNNLFMTLLYFIILGEPGITYLNQKLYKPYEIILEL